MTLATNITNAFAVVHRTYENVQKLMDYTKQSCEDYGYICKTDRFLRYKSDTNVNGWFIKNFIVLFQSKEDELLESGWHNGPVYALEIDLFNEEVEADEAIPTIFISKYEYENMREWTEGCSSANHWRFYEPGRTDKFEEISHEDGSQTIIPISNEQADKYYWGLRKVESTSFPLVEVTADNANEKIFCGFDGLA